jgi:hypothetical protein
MNALNRLLGSATLALVLAAGLAAPAMAQKIDGKNGGATAITAPAGLDFGDDTSQWANDGECDDPRFTGADMAAAPVETDLMHDATDCRTAFEAGTVQLAEGDADQPPAMPDPATVSTEIDFGDNTSQWARDGECDDPRFSGTGAAIELVEADLGHDADDCRAAFEAGTVQLAGDTPADAPQTNTPAATNTPPTAPNTAAIDFGDNTSQWANDGECDDPRFNGTASALELVEADLGHDAADCEAALAAGTVQYVGDGSTPIAPAIDFGDDTSMWARDDECDDPRFSGEGAAVELLDADRGHDATDCQAAYEAGTVTYVGENGPDLASIDFGDDTSQWANDMECDDPRFAGEAMAAAPVNADIGHDATDCRTAFEAGTVTYTGEIDVTAFDYGADWSQWANDGECDDGRFTGPGMTKKVFPEDQFGDATDCRTLEAQGQVSIRTVYSPEYQAGAPYDADTSGIDFGDNTSSYANDDICDDPRFEGPGVASVLLDGDTLHDSVDCSKAYEEGSIVLREDA